MIRWITCKSPEYNTNTYKHLCSMINVQTNMVQTVFNQNLKSAFFNCKLVRVQNAKFD